MNNLKIVKELIKLSNYEGHLEEIMNEFKNFIYYIFSNNNTKFYNLFIKLFDEGKKQKYFKFCDTKIKFEIMIRNNIWLNVYIKQIFDKKYKPCFGLNMNYWNDKLKTINNLQKL